MRNKIIFSSLIFLSIAAIFYVTWIKSTVPKIAYIHNAILFKEFKGSLESRKEFDKKIEAFQSNMDTLVRDYQKEVNMYSSQKNKLTPAERNEKEQYFKKREQELFNYKYSLQNKIKEEEDKYNQHIVNQVNSLLNEFGAKEGYDYILGVTESGSLLYSSEKKDVTKEALKYINEKYEDK